MRLLHVHDFTFTDFPHNPPKYITASHRWQQPEASLTDIRTKQNAHTLGYRKVQGFAKYIRENIPDVHWLWIDTCCVNQDSSQEVSEAINSMFRWYACAEACLVYLADVGGDAPEGHADGEGGHAFEKAEWFTRGWTLQELLASSTAVFLNREWEVIGFKGRNKWLGLESQLGRCPGLEERIAAITGIPRGVLWDFGESRRCSVEEKFGWMRGRMTTREEDMSYSMLGIFDVSMVPLYGEGADKASQRLRKEIAGLTLRADGQTGVDGGVLEHSSAGQFQVSPQHSRRAGE
jgi:hypothetical protein